MRVSIVWAVFALNLAFMHVALGQSANDGRVPIEPAEARLIVAPYAFGSEGVSRWLIDRPSARYEIWTTQFDFDQRFYHIVLRENAPFRVVRDELDIEAAVQSMWPVGFADVAFEEEELGKVDSRLGEATYRRFTAMGAATLSAKGDVAVPPRSTACVGFVLPFGGNHGGFPSNSIQGLYCDPAELVLPTFDVEGTLQAIGVQGIYRP